MNTVFLLILSCQNPQRKKCFDTCDKQHKPLPSIEEIPNYCVQKLKEKNNKEKQTQKECIKERTIEILQYDKKWVGCLADCERKYP
ncbi:MAG: hypothetical protein CL916_08480 [Deltaproteobacteria bacterium]|nr:hypothetical protein [Deltaproteobacteria bacterium]